jgi:hypothetical protein
MNEVTRGLRSAFRRDFSSFLALNLSGCCMLASTTFSDSISMRLTVADLAESTFYAEIKGSPLSVSWIGFSLCGSFYIGLRNVWMIIDVQ